MTDTLAALRQQIQQLDARLAKGTIDADSHSEAKAKLERRLLDAVLADQPAPGKAAPTQTHEDTPAARPSTQLSLMLGALVLALAAAGYAVKGSPSLPSAGPPGSAVAGGHDNPADAAANEAKFAAVVDQLAQKLKEKPDNPDGWAMLARSYARLGKTAEAVPAFAKAVELRGDDAGLLADYADQLALRNDRKLAGEPTALIERALKIDPNHPKTLALAGSAAFDRGDYAGAVKHWEQLARISPPGTEFGSQLQAGIDEARKLGGLPAAAPIQGAAAPAADAAPAKPAVAAGPAASPQPAAAGTAKISGTVRLAASAAALAGPEDTVFVLARPAEGSRMPLAVQRYKVKDLPLLFTLDDSMAMAPQARLSLFERVVVVARVSKSGQAVPAPGDISGQSAPVPNNARDLVIEIADVVK